MDADEAEAAVHDLMSQYSVDNKLWSTIEETASMVPEPDDETEADLHARLALLKRRKKRLCNLYVAEDMSWEEYEHAKSAYNAEIEAIEAELQCQETSRTLFMNSLSRFRQLDTFVQRAKPKERKELVAELFDELHIDPDSATITDYTMKSWTQRLLR